MEDQELDMAIRDICADEQTSSNSLQNEGGFNRDKYSRSRHKETPPTSTSQPSTKYVHVVAGTLLVRVLVDLKNSFSILHSEDLVKGLQNYCCSTLSTLLM